MHALTLAPAQMVAVVAVQEVSVGVGLVVGTAHGAIIRVQFTSR